MTTSAMVHNAERDASPTTPPVAKPDAMRIGPEHASLVADFLRIVWDPAATVESVTQGRKQGAAENPATPGEPPPSFALILEQRIVGFVATIPVVLWQNGHGRVAHWFNGLMVLPELRNGPIGFMVLKEAVRQLPLTMAVPVAAPARRLFTAMGFAELGVIPNFVRVLRPLSFLRKLDLVALGVGGVPAWLRSAFEAARTLQLTPLMAAALWTIDNIYVSIRRRVSDLETSSVTSIDAAELDRLWEKMRGSIQASPVRDAAHLVPRYSRGDLYRYVTVRQGSALRAVAVVRRPSDDGNARLNGIRVATFSDLICAPDDDAAILAAMKGVDAAARAMGADAVVCSASLSRLGTMLRRAGYVQVGGNAHLLVRDSQKGGHPPLSEWHVMRGDARGDEVF